VCALQLQALYKQVGTLLPKVHALHGYRPCANSYTGLLRRRSSAQHFTYKSRGLGQAKPEPKPWLMTLAWLVLEGQSRLRPSRAGTPLLVLSTTIAHNPRPLTPIIFPLAINNDPPLHHKHPHLQAPAMVVMEAVLMRTTAMGECYVYMHIFSSLLGCQEYERGRMECIYQVVL